MAIAEEASRQRRRTVQIALIFIILATVPCYCVGLLLLAARPAPTGGIQTATPTFQFGAVTATPLATTPVITLVQPLTATNPIFVPLTPTQSFFFTATFSFPTPFFPTITPAFPTIPVFPSPTPIIPPTLTPFFTNTPFFTDTPFPSITPIPIITDTPIPIMTDTPSLTPTETPTREIFPPTSEPGFESPTPDIFPPPPPPGG